jgi:hypothetical protein
MTIRKVLVILVIIAVFFAIPLLAWSGESTNTDPTLKPIRQPQGDYTIVLARPYGFYWGNQLVSVSTIEAKKVQVYSSGIFYVVPMLKELGAGLMVPTYNVNIVIKNK